MVPFHGLTFDINVMMSVLDLWVFMRSGDPSCLRVPPAHLSAISCCFAELVSARCCFWFYFICRCVLGDIYSGHSCVLCFCVMQV